MSLPSEVARCSGIEDEAGHLDALCMRCQRRTDRSTFPLAVWLRAPLEQPCGMYLPPDPPARQPPAQPC